MELKLPTSSHVVIFVNCTFWQPATPRGSPGCNTETSLALVVFNFANVWNFIINLFQHARALEGLALSNEGFSIRLNLVVGVPSKC